MPSVPKYFLVVMDAPLLLFSCFDSCDHAHHVSRFGDIMHT
ncbi:hypothetical protein PSYPI_44056 [Pseudomonas syringae pv. pisi str. 1704B]|uniref:Uncharacterized protein n=1 Tax=Pseudomonas syringae pv. pisi str. 1704B TaxID=629263 RepID=F3GPE4_PSESJ|nr:hypothetical protein PSYPI_44056 [Pseudomonas syringae pv. pisi str. 1704B]